MKGGMILSDGGAKLVLSRKDSIHDDVAAVPTGYERGRVTYATGFAGVAAEGLDAPAAFLRLARTAR